MLMYTDYIVNAFVYDLTVQELLISDLKINDINVKSNVYTPPGRVNIPNHRYIIIMT